MTLRPLIDELREALMGGSTPSPLARAGAGHKAKFSQGASKFKSKPKGPKVKLHVTKPVKPVKRPSSPKPPKPATSASKAKSKVP